MGIKSSSLTVGCRRGLQRLALPVITTALMAPTCPLGSFRASQVVLVVKDRPANAGDTGSMPGWGRNPGRGNGNPLQHSCLENPHGLRSLAGYSSWSRKELDMTERLSKDEEWLVKPCSSASREVPGRSMGASGSV